MFLEMYLKIIVTIIVNSKTSKYLAKQARLLSERFVKSLIYFKTPFAQGRTHATKHQFEIASKAPRTFESHMFYYTIYIF